LNAEETEDQKLMREALAVLASQFPDQYWRERDEKGEFPQEYFDSLAIQGWFNLNVPSEYNGAGLGLSDVSITIHELSKRLGKSAGDIVMAICVFAIQTIKTYANDSLKHSLLPELGMG